MWKRERSEPVDLEHVMTESPAPVPPTARPVAPPLPTSAPAVELPAQRTVVAGKGSTLGPTLRFKGDLVADEDLVIQGHIEGSILHTRSLTIDSQGVVRGDIRARRIIVEGSVDGNLYALERATLSTGAIVRGDIFAAEIVIEDGACLNGRIDMDNAPAIPTIKKTKAGSTETANSALSSPEVDALLRDP